MKRGSHEKMIERLRAKGRDLAPVVVDGRIVRSKPSSKPPAQRAALGAPVADQGGQGPITRAGGSDRSTGLTAPGDVFEFVIGAPCEFLNANRSKGHWGNTAPLVKKWRRAGRLAAAAAGLPLGLARVQVDAFVIKPIQNDYDPANWAPTAKAVLDGLVDYGMVEDDNRHFVTGPFMHAGGKGDDALTVRVTVLDMS